MLQLYVGRNSLPKGVPFIFDVDAAFPMVDMTGSDFQREVIKTVDKGEYYNNMYFTDRYGGGLRYDKLCSGSKALLLLDAKKDAIINFTECGDNALLLLSKINEGMLFFEDRDHAIPYVTDYPIFYNGVEWKGVSQVNYWLC